MSYEHFGDLLRQLRKSRKLTREQLAQNICTPKQIYRIEKGEFDPSIYLLNQLSIKFNMDLNEYYKMHFTNHSIVGYEGIIKLNNAMAASDLDLLLKLIEKYEKLDEFKEGENLQHILYAKALYCSIMKQEFANSLDLCFQAIRIEDPDFSIDKIETTIYSNVGLTIINCISCNYLALKQHDLSIKVLYGLLYNIEHFILDTPYPMYQAGHFAKKIYQSTINNLCVQLMNNGKMEQSLYYVDIGIDFSLKENNMHFLPELLYMKFKLLYYAQDFTEAKEYYQRAINLYKITKQERKLIELEENRKKYPDIF